MPITCEAVGVLRFRNKRSDVASIGRSRPRARARAFSTHVPLYSNDQIHVTVAFLPASKPSGCRGARFGGICLVGSRGEKMKFNRGKGKKNSFM